MLKSKKLKGRRITEKLVELEEWFLEATEGDPETDPDPPPGGRQLLAAITMKNPSVRNG